MEKLCETCGDTFYINDEEGWKRQCFGCWKREKNNEESERMIVARLRRRVDVLETEARLLRVRQNATVPTDQIRRLIQLCHPDKHNGSLASLAATKWLLEIRGK